VVDIGFADNTKFIFTNPSPESNWLSNFTLLKFGLRVKVEYLDHSFGALGGSKGDNVLASVHENALSLHWLSLQLEIVGGVNDRAIVGVFNTDVFLTLESNRSKLEEFGTETQIS
jgi:hypothetical protein